jgi:hypothetical protein
MSLLDILTQALNTKQVKDDQFDQVTHHATNDQLGAGVAEAFRSDQTPPMAEMVSSMFGKSNPQQQAGALNQIISALGPMVVAGLASGALAKVLKPGQTQITPEQASQLSPTQVRDVVAEAQAKKPEIADQMGQFYANHSGLVKTLGGAALLIALAKMKQHMDQR